MVRHPPAPLRWSRALLAFLLLFGASAAFAAPGAAGAALRLVVAGVVDGRPEVGIEIALEPGWKTYWRNPGDAGIPPVVDWSKSAGVASFDLRFPAPVRFGEEGTTSIGYTAPVILPIDLALADPAKPATLDLDVQIGLCRDICVPVSARLTATVSPTGPVDAAALARLREARTRLPLPAVKGVAPWVMALERDPDSVPGSILVKVKMPEEEGDAAGRDMLVEGPTGDWSLPLPARIATGRGREIWRFDLDGVPRGARLEGSELRFTMRIRDRVVEQNVTLDGAAAAP
ncbi:MAG: protein-disulfide reductase DsbD family protein [Siculibacillus sp.]|nr:protein-disulfide reductase DsbD family protein [Siculibacillus sp.]